MSITAPRLTVPVVSYDDFLSMFNYRQDQHITVCGPTGCGKSVLLVETIMPQRGSWIYYSTKPKDATVEDSRLTSKTVGWTDDPYEIHPWVHRKWVVGLKGLGDPDSLRERHRELFSNTLDRLFAEPAWAHIIDEGRYICDPEYLGLRKKVAQYYFQGRSDNKSIVIATQRPRHVPLEAFDQATHLFFFNDDDLQNVLRMAEAAGANRQEFRDVIPHLEVTEQAGGQFLYYNTRTKEKVISKVEI